VQKLSSIVAFILPMQIKVFSENSSLKSEFLQTSFQSIQVFVQLIGSSVKNVENTFQVRHFYVATKKLFMLNPRILIKEFFVTSAARCLAML